MNALQTGQATVRTAAARYNLRGRIGLIDAFRLKRAFNSQRNRLDRVALSKVFAEEARGTSRKKAGELVEDAAREGLEQKEPALALVTRLTTCDCTREPSSELSRELQTREAREKTAEEITTKLAFKTLGDALVKAYLTTYVAILGTLASTCFFMAADMLKILYGLIKTPSQMNLTAVYAKIAIATVTVTTLLILALKLRKIRKDDELKTFDWLGPKTIELANRDD